MSRFVILTHDFPDWHWDFMLESAGVLRTWRLDQEPIPGRAISATPLPDHRIIYLEYEGPVSGSRGSVQRWDWGEYELLDESDNQLTVRLDGTRLTGLVKLTIHADGSTWYLQSQPGEPGAVRTGGE